MSLEDILYQVQHRPPGRFYRTFPFCQRCGGAASGRGNTSHYVDSVGYREIPEFTKEMEVSAEKQGEEIPAVDVQRNTRRKRTGRAGQGQIYLLCY